MDIHIYNRIAELMENLTGYDALPVQIVNNFNFKERAIHFTRSTVLYRAMLQARS